MTYIFYALLFTLVFISCKTETKPKNKNATSVSANAKPSPENTTRYVKSIQIIYPQKNDTCVFGEKIKINFAYDKRYKIDSSHILYNNSRITTLDSNTREYIFKIPEGKCGTQTIKVMAFHPNQRQGIATMPIVIKPNKAPVSLDYQLINTFPHDNRAYTQGLVFHDNFMYEGTGQYGASSLRKTDLQNNKILSVLHLDRSYFGEGITIYKDKIYQITWKSHKGFVYDLNTFTLETTFDYQTQGWGITTMDDKLIMSDGTHVLYHLDPETFNILKRVEVFDHNGPVLNLNELEFINGMIWANVWLTDRIAVIDPQTGGVKQELHLPDLLTKEESGKLDENDDVLNGIAYNAQKGTLYVTGKRWPKLFELKIKPVK